MSCDDPLNVNGRIVLVLRIIQYSHRILYQKLLVFHLLEIHFSNRNTGITFFTGPRSTIGRAPDL